LIFALLATVCDRRLLQSEDPEDDCSSLLALQQKTQSDQSDSNTAQPMKRPPVHGRRLLRVQ